MKRGFNHESKFPRCGQRGFTLIEIILVLAVITILVALLFPSALSIILEAQEAAVRADEKTITAATIKFFRDVKEWPTRDANQLGAGGEVNLLYSGRITPGLTEFSVEARTGMAAFDCDTPTNCESFTFPYISNLDLVDSSNVTAGGGTNLTVNAYPTGTVKGTARWRGPYLNEDALDPFGKPYLIYVMNLRRTSSPILAPGKKRAWIVSAGPNRVYETTPGSPLPRGDDIVFFLVEPEVNLANP